LAFENAADEEARRLEDLRLGAVEEWIDAELELGAGHELVGELEALARQWPLRERLQGQLMLALYRAGRQAEALGVYHETRRALVDELGIEPSPGLQQLYRSMLRQEPALERVPPPAHAPEDHLGDVIKAMLGGRLVTVVGAGVNSGVTQEHSLPKQAEVVAHLV